MNKQVKIYILRFTNTLGDTVKGRVVAGNGTLGTVRPGGSGWIGDGYIISGEQPPGACTGK